ncbi:MAG: hypothetical protein ACRD2C_25260 [Acidimicrobiales bacterium]
MSRVAWSVAGLGIGMALGTVAFVGIAASQQPPGWDREPLDLVGYCRSVHGAGAFAYRPPNVEAWRCSVRSRGIWELVAVDLDAACDWQNGDLAELEEVEVPPGAHTRGKVRCTV